MKRIDYSPERPATLHLESWAGRVTRRITVLGETPKRYRVRFDEDGGAHNYTGRAGSIGLVPKYAVTFLADYAAGVPA